MTRYDDYTKSKVVQYLVDHSISEGKDKFNISIPTLVRWCKENGIRKKRGRPKKGMPVPRLTSMEKRFVDGKIRESYNIPVSEWNIIKSIVEKLELWKK